MGVGRRALAELRGDQVPAAGIGVREGSAGQRGQEQESQR